MLKKEFEERTNLSMTDEEFNGVNALYIACGDNVDKDVFCRCYTTLEGRLVLLHAIERERQMLKEALDEQKLLNQEQAEIISDAADAMLKISDMEGATVPVCDALDKKAWWLVGMKEVIKRKLRMSITLSLDEIEYINKHLK